MFISELNIMAENKYIFNDEKKKLIIKTDRKEYTNYV